MPKYANGSDAYVISDRSGFRYRTKDTRKEWNGLLVGKDEYEEDINFVFLNVDNQKWGNYIEKFSVNGIPQVNLFDKKGNLISTFIGKQMK